MAIMINVTEYIKNKFKESVNLSEGTDVEGTIATIEKGIEIRGANVWILICAAMLASIGLDVSSSAVIIGAMLISPLMSPILGIGLGVGISDREMLFQSIKNFSLTVFISLLASTLYFLFSPLAQPTAEMAARIKPTLLDVGVAVFGGVAGIVANSRREKTNAIPGVAIATALMPPLCTAGFGIATGSATYFFGAFYLFFINAVFISLSTYIVTRLLKFPQKEMLDGQMRKRLRAFIGGFALVVMVPSMIIFWDVIVEAKMNKDVQAFINNRVNNEKYEAVRWEVQEGDSTDLLKMFVIGEPIKDREIQKIKNDLTKYNLKNMDLKLVQMNVSQDQREQIKNEVSGEVAKNVLKEIQFEKQAEKKANYKIDSLNYIIKTLSLDPGELAALKNEVSVVFPDIKGFSVGLLSKLPEDSIKYNVPFCLVDFNNGVYRRERDKQREQLMHFMKLRLKKDSVYVVTR